MGADATREGFIRLPIRGMPKKRPKVTRNGTYMPKEYVQWKKDVAAEMVAAGVEQAGIEMPIELEVVFGEDYIEFQLFPYEAHKRAKHVTADIDNLVGGLMDALEQGGVIANDKQIVRIKAWVASR